MHSRYHIRNFGVLEIIISVAILAAFSVFVLKLFVGASDSEKKVQLLDRADYAAVTYIEQFKGSASPFAVCAKLGGVKESGGYYKNTVCVADGMNAVIEIKKDSDNAAGSLYVMNVVMKNNKDGKDIYQLSGYKFFGSEAGEIGG